MINGKNDLNRNGIVADGGVSEGHFDSCDQQPIIFALHWSDFAKLRDDSPQLAGILLLATKER
ncbi:MAG: hypothetical protein CVV30_12620 [Methanomicrobiales archaeon HGW-Methanomicrobiales-1]|jgi:hypothetical protein|nr:MAG: hypothetical protein CVV30_12620 [Methanomicrobiales archaeon HGW-Methanomicrobiales-1]